MEQSSSLKAWLPALVGMVCLGLGMGLMGIYGFFVDPLAEEFNVSRALINSGPIFLLLMPAFLGPLAGKLADTLPIRNLLLIGVIVSMGSLYATSYASSLTLVTLCFVCFAAGMVFYGPISVNAFLIKHYRSRAGRALAIAAMGVSLATAVLPLLVAWLLESYSWRDSLSTLAIILAVVLVASILFGLSRSEQVTVDSLPDDTVDMALPMDKSFLRQPTFWVIGVVVALAFSAALVVAICYPPHFVNRGFSEIEAGMFLTAGGLAGLVGKLVVAAVVDRLQSWLKYFAMLLLLSQLIGFGSLMFTDSFYPTILAVIVAGFGGGGFIPMHPILNNGYFDSAIIGRVNGAQMPMMLPLGLVGLPLSGFVFDKTGSYQLVFAAVVIMFAIATILLLQLPKIDLEKQEA